MKFFYRYEYEAGALKLIELPVLKETDSGLIVGYKGTEKFIFGANSNRRVSFCREERKQALKDLERRLSREGESLRRKRNKLHQGVVLVRRELKNENG